MGTKVFDNALDLITFTRASRGTALRKISYGPELVTNGDYSDGGTGWAAGVAGITYVDGVARYAAVNNSFNNRQSGVITPSKTYLVTYTLSNYSGGGIQVKLNGATSTLGTLRTANGTYTQVLAASSTADGVLCFACGTFSGDIDNVSVKEVLFDRPDGTLTLFNHPTNVPRIEYDASGAVKGLLVEEARTNLVTWSDDFTNAAWNKTGATVSGDTFTATATSVNIFQSVAGAGLTNSYTIEAKAGTAQFCSIRSFSGTSSVGESYFDLSSGTVSLQAAGQTATITPAENGFFRCTVTATTASAPAYHAFRFVDASGATAVTIGRTAQFRRAQLEAGAFATSYIPTAGATATRAADIASIPVSAFGYNQQAGTVVVEWNQPVGAASYLAMLYDGTAANRAFLRQFADGKVYWSTITDNAAQGDVLSGTAVDGSYNKVAAALRLNDAAAALNGAAAVVDATYLVPKGITSLAIGSYAFTAVQYVNGHIKSITYYPRRLSNAQLQELTT